jgi:adenine-specific DNA glycosylase
MSRALRSPLAQLYNDMHGLIVAIGKHYCLKNQPRCERCPLQKFLPGTGSLVSALTPVIASNQASRPFRRRIRL